MAQSTVIKHRKTKSKKNAPVLPFIPEAVQAFIARRFIDVLALCMAGLGVFMILLIKIYN